MKSAFKTVQDDRIHEIRVQEEEVLKLASLADAEKLNCLKSTVTRLADQAQICDRSLMETQHLELLSWISSTPFSRHHELHSGNLLPGSGEWLLEHPEFRTWKASSSSSILLLHGIPGSGKTALCAKVVDWFLSEGSGNIPLAPLAYFYCTECESEPERAFPDAIMRSIVRQLAVTSNSQPKAHEALVSEFERRQATAKVDGFELPKLSIAECADLILEVARNNPANLVIDAVDEIAEQTRYSLLKALTQIVSESSNVIKVFVTSRNNSNIFGILKNAKKICIHAHNNEGDVEQFARNEVDKVVQESRLLNGLASPQLQADLVQILLDGAGEM